MLLRSLIVVIMCLVMTIGIRTLNNRGQADLPAVAEPEFTRVIVLDWMKQGMSGAFTFNRQNYKQIFQQASTFFTPQAYEQFGSVIGQLGVLNIMQNADLASVASIPTIPMITASGVTDGAYEWAINTDLTLAIYQAGETTPQMVPLRFRVLVRQVGTEDRVTGLVITGMTPMRLDEGERLP